MTNTITGQNPINRMYIEELKKWLQTSDDLPKFNETYHLNEKTKPKGTTTYIWYKQITGTTYGQAMKQKELSRKNTKKEKPKRKAKSIIIREEASGWEPEGAVKVINLAKLGIKQKKEDKITKLVQSGLRQNANLKAKRNKKKLENPKDPFKTYKVTPPPNIPTPKPPQAKLSPLEKAKQEAEIELLHQQNREAKARAELAELELRKKLKELREFEIENEKE